MEAQTYHRRQIRKWSHHHGGRFLEIDKYAVQSGLALINPDLKILVGVVSLALCLLSEKGITAAVVALCMTYLTLEKGKMKWREYVHFLLVPCSFIMLGGIVLLVDLLSTPLGFLNISMGRWYLSITWENLWYAGLVSLRALAGITCLYMISFSTPLYEIIGVLRRAHIPGIIIELMYLIYRFIFILLDVYENMKISAMARMGYCNIKRSYASFFGICTNLLPVAFSKASKSFDCMEARGYDGELKFLERKKPVTRKQTVAAAGYLAAAVVILLVERRFL